MVDIHELLVKVGMAIYLHKKQAEDAAKASAAVDYLKEKGAIR